ncbi:MAG: EamA family transporter RarD [Paracoccaceae bacterium]
MSAPAKGIIAMIAACVIWSFSSLYYKLLADIPPLEVLGHRSFWSLVFFMILLAAQRRLPALWALLKDRRAMRIVAFAAVMISANWFFFIFAVQNGHAMDASFGYYIFPLLAVLIGTIAFKERLDLKQKIAIFMVVLAVVALSVGLGRLPFVALALAITFALYGVAKRGLDAGPVISVTAEVVLLGPIALIWLLGVHFAGWQGIAGAGDALGAAARDAAPLPQIQSAFFGRDWPVSLLLIFAGPLTATPLILFSYATKRINYATLGLVQYLNPTIQFSIAVGLYGEVFTRAHALAFPLIWAALALYTYSAIAAERSRAKAAAMA